MSSRDWQDTVHIAQIWRVPLCVDSIDYRFEVTGILPEEAWHWLMEQNWEKIVDVLCPGDASGTSTAMNADKSGLISLKNFDALDTNRSRKSLMQRKQRSLMGRDTAGTVLRFKRQGGTGN